jgi:hypothetical protein
VSEGLAEFMEEEPTPSISPISLWRDAFGTKAKDSTRARDPEGLGDASVPPALEVGCFLDVGVSSIRQISLWRDAFCNEIERQPQNQKPVRPGG